MDLHKHGLKAKRGKSCVITLQRSATTDEILAMAVPKFKVIDPAFEDGTYCLLYPNMKSAETVPPDNQPFTLQLYKEFLGKPYQKITLFVCLKEDFDLGIPANQILLLSMDCDTCKTFERLS